MKALYTGLYHNKNDAAVMVKQYPSETPRSAGAFGIPAININTQAKKLRARVPRSANQRLYKNRTVL